MWKVPIFAVLLPAIAFLATWFALARERARKEDRQGYHWPLLLCAGLTLLGSCVLALEEHRAETRRENQIVEQAREFWNFRNNRQYVYDFPRVGQDAAALSPCYDLDPVPKTAQPRVDRCKDTDGRRKVAEEWCRGPPREHRTAHADENQVAVRTQPKTELDKPQPDVRAHGNHGWACDSSWGPCLVIRQITCVGEGGLGPEPVPTKEEADVRLVIGLAAVAGIGLLVGGLFGKPSGA